MKKTLWLIVVVASMVGLSATSASELNVYAAANLSDALKELSVNYEKQTGDKLVFNLGASSTLARQIQGAGHAGGQRVGRLLARRRSGCRLVLLAGQL